MELMEFMEILSDYLVLFVAGTCYLVGYIIKTSIPKLDNDFIPLIVGVLGVILNVWYNNWSLTPDIFLSGLASGLAATGANEGFKKLFGKK